MSIRIFDHDFCTQESFAKSPQFAYSVRHNDKSSDGSSGDEVEDGNDSEYEGVIDGLLLSMDGRVSCVSKYRGGTMGWLYEIIIVIIILVLMCRRLTGSKNR